MLTKALGSRSDELLTISVARVTSSSVASHERDGIVSRSKRTLRSLSYAAASLEDPASALVSKSRLPLCQCFVL